MLLIVSDRQQKDSALYMHISILPQIPLKSKVPHNIEQVPSAMQVLMGYPYMYYLFIWLYCVIVTRGLYGISAACGTQLPDQG